MRIEQPSPAIYGSHVKSIDRAGPRAVEVTGAMSRSERQAGLRQEPCAGESAVLVIDRGKKNERIDVLFTSRGVFHAMVDVDRGTEHFGCGSRAPRASDSGPFARIQVGGGGDWRRVPRLLVSRGSEQHQ